MSKPLKIALLLAFLVLMVCLPLFMNSYQMQIIITTVTYAMLGLTFAMGMKVGLLRFDVAAWWAVGAYTTAVLVTKAGWNYWLTIPIGGLIAVVVGYGICLLTIRRGMMVFFLVGMVTTMVFYQIFGSLNLFGSWSGISGIPSPTIGSFQFIHKTELFYFGLVLMILVLVIYYLLYNSKIGTAWNAIGSSIKLANSVGIDVVRYRTVNILIGNFFLAMVGSYYVAYSGVAAPTTFSFNNSVYVMMYLVVGGMNHSLIGPILGALIITFIPEYLRAAREYEPIIRSVFIILIIIFLPNGVLGWIDKHVSPRFKKIKWMARFREKIPEEEGLADPAIKSRT